MKRFILSLPFFVMGLGLGIIILHFFPLNDVLISRSPLLQIFPRKVKVVGFLPYWLLSKSANSYESTLSELSYFSLPISADGTIQKLDNPQEESPGWTSLNKSTALQTKLDTARERGQSLSLVVFSGNKQTIYDLISDPQVHAQNLLSEVLPLMREHHFTDLNLDLEVVGTASESSRVQFTQFVQAVKQGLTNSGLGTLTLDLQAVSLFDSYLTDPVQLAPVVDYLLLMTYDFHYPGSFISGPVAPISGAGESRVLDVQTVLSAALQQIPRTKIILGVPLYGYEWETISSTPSAAVIPGTGVTASDSRASSTLSTCSDCIYGQLDTSSEPYLVYPESGYFNQIFYENSAAISSKVHLAQTSQIAGLAFWALGYENPDDLAPLKSYLGTLIPGQ